MDYRAFTEALASNSPTPGGGGAAALVGAVGAALGHMVGALTVGKKKYAAVEAELTACMERIDALRLRLLELERRRPALCERREFQQKCLLPPAAPARLEQLGQQSF